MRHLRKKFAVELGPALIAALDVRFVETDKPSSGFELAPVSIPTTKHGDYLLLVRLPTSRRKSFSWLFAHVHVTVASSWVIVRDPYMGGCATGVFRDFMASPQWPLPPCGSGNVPRVHEMVPHTRSPALWMMGHCCYAVMAYYCHSLRYTGQVPSIALDPLPTHFPR